MMKPTMATSDCAAAAVSYTHRDVYKRQEQVTDQQHMHQRGKYQRRQVRLFGGRQMRGEFHGFGFQIRKNYFLEG